MRLIIYTDIGDDIDDTLALRYAQHCDHITDIIVILNHLEIHKRVTARESIASRMTKVSFVGHGNDLQMDAALMQHIATDTDPYTILCIGPTTECARHITSLIPRERMSSLTFQCRLIHHDTLWETDLTSRNAKLDLDACQRLITTTLPITRIGKYAAYNLPLTRDRFALIESTYGEFGRTIHQQAHHRQHYFITHNPIKYQEIYGSNRDVLSYPYDLVALMSIVHPELFVSEECALGKSIGHTEWNWLHGDVMGLLGRLT